MSHQYSHTCIYCNKYIFVPFFKLDRSEIICVKQRNKYGKTLYAHKECYLSQTIGAKEACNV